MLIKSLRKLSFIIIVLVLIFVPVGCNSGYAENPIQDRETLFQISTINALMEGLYDSVITVGDLLKYGDFGI
ncbi:MAG: acetolactate decarboxylase, partial [Dehalococcoidales bacterium]